MKCTKVKKKGVYLKLELDRQEAKYLLHFFGCRKKLQYCNEEAVKTGAFQEAFYEELCNVKILG